jgi:hypothetical protein
MQTLAFSLLGFLGRELVRMRRWIIYELREQDCPTCRQWTTGPPEMQSRWMPSPGDSLLVLAGVVDVL